MPKIDVFERCSDTYDDWFEPNQNVYGAELKAVRQSRFFSPYSFLREDDNDCSHSSGMQLSYDKLHKIDHKDLTPCQMQLYRSV